MISKKGLAMLKTFESFVPLEYTCVAGRRTIGYGHVVKGGESFPAGVRKPKPKNCCARMSPKPKTPWRIWSKCR